jgi:hypothetical protein
MLKHNFRKDEHPSVKAKEIVSAKEQNEDDISFSYGNNICKTIPEEERTFL